VHNSNYDFWVVLNLLTGAQSISNLRSLKISDKSDEKVRLMIMSYHSNSVLIDLLHIPRASDIRTRKNGSSI
jgi:hypothetical protein